MYYYNEKEGAGLVTYENSSETWNGFIMLTLP